MPVRCFGGHGVTALPCSLYCKRIQITVFPTKNISHKGTESQRELNLVPLCLRVKKYNLLPFGVYWLIIFWRKPQWLKNIFFYTLRRLILAGQIVFIKPCQWIKRIFPGSGTTCKSVPGNGFPCGQWTNRASPTRNFSGI